VAIVAYAGVDLIFVRDIHGKYIIRTYKEEVFNIRPYSHDGAPYSQAK
jgi:hypothetical protein